MKKEELLKMLRVTMKKGLRRRLVMQKIVNQTITKKQLKKVI